MIGLAQKWTLKRIVFAHESGIINIKYCIPSELHLAYMNAPDVDRHFLTSRNSASTTAHGLEAVSYAVRIRASDLYFSNSKTNDPAYAVKICKIWQEIFDLRIRWPKSSDFGPKSDDLGHQIFE